MSWSQQQILQASLEWVWVPPGSERVEVDGLVAVVAPGRSVSVVGAVAANEVAATWRRIEDLAREREATVVGWTVADGTEHVADFLLTRGARSQDATDVVAASLPLALDIPEGTRTVLVADEQSVLDAITVATRVWGGEHPDDDAVRAQVREAAVPVAEREGFQVVTYSGGAPVATGGVTRAGEVARMWGAGTVPGERHQGAYRATVAARTRIAADLGCTLALVNALTDSSAPILTRLGFRRYGKKRTYRLELPTT